MNTLDGSRVSGALLALYNRSVSAGNAQPTNLEVAEEFYRRGVRDALKASAKLAGVAPTMRKFLDVLDGPGELDDQSPPG